MVVLKELVLHQVDLLEHLFTFLIYSPCVLPPHPLFRRQCAPTVPSHLLLRRPLSTSYISMQIYETFSFLFPPHVHIWNVGNRIVAYISECRHWIYQIYKEIRSNPGKPWIPMWDLTHPRETFTSSLLSNISSNFLRSPVLAFPIMPPLLTALMAAFQSAKIRICSPVSKLCAAPSIPAISPSHTVAVSPTLTAPFPTWTPSPYQPPVTEFNRELVMCERRWFV